MRPLPEAPRSDGVRSILGLLALAVLVLAVLGLPEIRVGGLTIAGEFLQASLRPALAWEDPVAGLETPFLGRLFRALVETLGHALGALSLALVPGLILGLLAAEGTPLLSHGLAGRLLRGGARWLLVSLRSLHELLWAVLLLAAMGLGRGTAVLALALPLVGTLGKIFAELLDETNVRPSEGLVQAGARPLQAYLLGRVPLAVPDLAAYTFYRLECTFRSSAVLGFFGFETLGSMVRASFEEGRYREVWTELYSMVLVVLVLEAWSAALRRRFVA